MENMVDSAEVLNAFLNAARQVSQKGAQADASEAAQFAQAALSFTQAFVALHPGMVAPQGVDPQMLQPPPPPPPEKPKTKKLLRDSNDRVTGIQET